LGDCLTVDDTADTLSRHDPLTFIKTNMRIAPVPALPEIRLYAAHPASGLWRLTHQEGQAAEPEEEGTEADEDGPEPQPPYWAYAWAGGAVLARYILDRPESVAKAGAREVLASEIDRNGVAALGLNAAANGVAITVVGQDITAGRPPPVDVVAAGDLFYGQDLADRVIPFLDRCLAARINVLIGDPGRAYLPRSRLRLLAEYRVPDVGEAKGAAMKPSGVFSFEPE
jgi:predicted nicotinamide N-methyase